MLYHSRFVKLSCKLLGNLKSFAHSKLFQVSLSFLLINFKSEILVWTRSRCFTLTFDF